MSGVAARPQPFRAGGTLPADAPSYIPRPADEELPRQIKAGQLCYILTPRQMGKSSLMVRTASQLAAAGVRCATVDLSALGVYLRPEQWFLGILHLLADELELRSDPDAWWQAQPGLPPAQRFTDFLADVVLTEIPGRVAIFIDEIDTTLALPFSDDFFAAIRATYNRRASEPAFQRLSVVLLGVAAPADLIKAPERTPFNVGRPIDLGYLSRTDAAPFARGLDTATAGGSDALLDHIFTWTSGHPYQTQRICAELIGSPAGAGAEAVDAIVQRIFLASAAPEESLKTVERTIQAMPERGPLLRLYRDIYTGKSIAEDRRSPLQSRLLLTGLVRAVNSKLEVANQIYRQVFDLGWVRQSMPADQIRYAVLASVVVIFLVFGGLWLFRNVQVQQTIDRLASDYTNSADYRVQLSMLVSLCDFSERGAERARTIFENEISSRRAPIIQEMPSLSPASRRTIHKCICNTRHQFQLRDQYERDMLYQTCQSLKKL